MEHLPTLEQQAILDGFTRHPRIVINAGAGCTKTSTLEMIGRSTDRLGLCISFNRAIAEEAAKRFPSNVTCVTGHKLAWDAVGVYYKHRLDAPRLRIQDTMNLLGIVDNVILGERTVSPAQVARLAMETVNSFCYSADKFLSMDHVPQVTGLNDEGHYQLAMYVLPFAYRAWDDLTRLTGRLRFSHDIYMKVWTLGDPVLNYDFIMIDEYQDSNPCLVSVINQQRAQVIVVGDSSQAIYEWRGSIDALAQAPGEHYTLSNSFRFGQAIADEANKWLELLQAPLRLTGLGGTSYVASIPVGDEDTVLCRTNAKCVAEAAALRRLGHSVAIVGGAEQVKRMAEASIPLKQGSGTTHPDLFMFKTWKEVQEYGETAEGRDLKIFVKLVDTYGSHGITQIINSLSHEDNADILVSTAHKFKGRESPKVRLSDDFKEQTHYDMKRSELMLIYVALTRAKQGLDCSSVSWVNKLLN